MKHPEIERAWLTTLACVSAVDPAGARELVESSRLTGDDFAHPALGDVFRAAADFVRRSEPLELYAIEAALASSAPVRNAGGRAFLVTTLFSQHAPPTKSASEHARLIRDGALRRKGIAALRAVSDQLRDPAVSASESLARGAEAWQSLVNQNPALCSAEGDVFRLAERLDAAQKGRRQLVVPTGIVELDKAIGGLQPGVLTLIGALPGVGKSALLATVLRNVANAGQRIGMFSLEDERDWVARRLLSLESGVPLFVLGTRPLGDKQAGQVLEVQANVYETLRNVVIDDRPALTADEVAQTARDMILNHQCKAVLVDHLGELSLSRSERYDLDISDALKALRDVAKRHHVPVVVASHVRRRQGLGIEDEPNLTDFANSSAPERMARVALGLSKPSADRLRISILKQTNGPSGHSIDLALVPHAAMVDSERVVTAATST